MGWVIRVLPFCSLLFYWGYLVLSTQPVMIYDAIGYENLGRLLLEHGWPVYFHDLNREPLFPFIISIAMRIEQATGISYTYFLKIILLIELAVAMAGAYRLARLMGAKRVWASIAVFYLGVSPAIVNSTLWLWSEAAAFPFVVWGVVWLVNVWREMFSERNIHDLVWYALVAAVLFIFATMVKAPIAAVFMGLLLPFYIAVLGGIFQRNWRLVYRALLVSFVCALMMAAYVENYKFLNWKGNGNYAITNRADIALLGNTVRRLHPDALKYIPQALLAAPRLGICEQYFKDGSCGFWSAITSDKINVQYGDQLKSAGYNEIQRQEMFFSTSFRLMREHPFQEAFFSCVESLKLFFWENRVYFVKYPDALTRIFSQRTLMIALSMALAFFSLTGLVTAGYRAFRFRRMPEVFAVLFVCLFMVAYMLFFVDIRYAFPLAPIFIAMIAAIGSKAAASNLEGGV